MLLVSNTRPKSNQFIPCVCLMPQWSVIQEGAFLNSDGRNCQNQKGYFHHALTCSTSSVPGWISRMKPYPWECETTDVCSRSQSSSSWVRTRNEELLVHWFCRYGGRADTGCCDVWPKEKLWMDKQIYSNCCVVSAWTVRWSSKPSGAFKGGKCQSMLQLLDME